MSSKKIKDKERDSIDFGKSRIGPLFTRIFYLITTGLALMFGVGVSVVASIHLAQNNHKAANINITQAFDVATLLMLVIAIAVFLFRIPFLRLLGSSDALLPLCQAYWQQRFSPYGEH